MCLKLMNKINCCAGIEFMGLKQISLKSYYILAAIMTFITQNSYAQNLGKSVNYNNSWEIGFSGGVSKYLESANPHSNAVYKRFNYWNADYNGAFSLFLIKNISPTFCAEIEWLNTKLSGSWDQTKGYPIPPNINSSDLPVFKTGINQWNLLVGVNLNQLIAPAIATNKWRLFVKGGVGMTLVKGFESNDLFNDKFETLILYGGGFEYKINTRIRLRIETAINIVRTDRLDGFRTVDNNSLSISRINERYIYSYFGMSYRLGKAESMYRKIRNSKFKSVSRNNKR